MKKLLMLVWGAMSAMVAMADLPSPLLVVDYNRDRKIDNVDLERLNKGESFTIWRNDGDCEDEEVNGLSDLLDFFPVLVDVNGVGEWSNYTWELSSESVNVVFTGLDSYNAGSFYTQACKALDGDTPLYEAEVSKLAEGDVELPKGFLKDGRGVFLIEGAAIGDKGLTLRGYDGDGKMAYEVTLKLHVKNVNLLYDWINLRSPTPTSSSTSTSSSDPRHFVFVHGYNLNEEEARSSAADFYKKLWQSGSDARFTAVDWSGDQSQVKYLFKNVSPNYFANVENAFLAAESFAEVCDKLPGEKILVGHGLGNVLISSAIKDYGLSYLKYVMLNAEVAGKDFEAGGHFANLPRTINYYSPSDSFFAESALDVEKCEVVVFNRAFGEALHTDAKLWSLNEKIKKSSHAIELANGAITDIFYCLEADTITEEQLKYADVIESPAAGTNEVATLKNVNLEGFIDDYYGHEWPVKVEESINVWNHSTFREVAYYHTSRFYDSLLEKPLVILDTDLGSSMDDLFAVDLVARMHKAGALELKAVMMDRPDKSDPEEKGEFLTFADRYLASLGFKDLPIGKAKEKSETLGARVFNPYWTLIYSNEVANASLLMPTNRTDEAIKDLPDAVILYRRLLNDAPDKSVVICSTGFLSNLQMLMESGSNYCDDNIYHTGLELIERKVKELRIMAGCFDPDKAPADMGGAEYNAAGDPVAANMVLEQWPTPVIVSPWEVGLELEYEPSDVLADFPLGTPDPVLRAAYVYWPKPLREGDMNRLWDPMTVLPIVDGDTLVPLSKRGGISVNESTGVTTFSEDASSNRYYQVASKMDVEAVMNRLREIFCMGNPIADTVVYGTIRTAEKDNPLAEVIAIKDGKYIYVGNEKGASKLIDEDTKIIDRRGKGMVMPGCTDGHSHYTMKFGMDNMKGGVMFDLEDDKAAVLKKLKEATSKAKEKDRKTLFGFGWNIITLLVKDQPTLKELDDATGDISTVIFDQAGHHCFCNSECLKRCGIIDGEGNVLIDKIDGGVLELDEKGYPTGLAEERVTGYFMRMGGIDYDEVIDDEAAEAAILETQKFLLSTGYTAALEGWSNMLHTNRLYAAAKRLDENKKLKFVFPMTYEVEPWQTNIDDEITYLDSLNKTYRTRHVLPEYLKVFMDGVVETRTGAMINPYKDGTVYKSFWSVDRLADITGKCNAKGLTVHTHVMGDAAIMETADAYIQGGDKLHRNCLVHLRNVCKEDFQRFAENNIACTAGFTWHISNEKEFNDLVSEFLNDEYLYHAYPIKSFFDAGVKVSSHSDFPANIPCPQDPFGIMEVAVTGQDPNDPMGGMLPVYDEDELVTRTRAFEALTLNGAWQLGLENERGSIKVGKWADFVLTDQDVFECAATDIGETKVVSTWFEGEKVFEAPLGSKANPWKIGAEGHEAEVTAWTNGADTLVVKGKGAIGSTPWAGSADGIKKLIKEDGVEGAEALVKSLPELTTVNGLTRDQFTGAAIGFVTADGFSAIAVDPTTQEATLSVVVSKAETLDAPEWKPVSTNDIPVKADTPSGFFIVAPALPPLD